MIENREVSKEEIAKKIEDNEIEDAIVITRENGQIKLTYIVEDMTMMDEDCPRKVCKILLKNFIPIYNYQN